MSEFKCTLCKIRKVYHDIVVLENEINQKYGLTLNEAMLLCSLSEKEQLTSTEIAEEMGLSCSNTSKVIKSVEDKGMILRSLGVQDKRSMLFSLTEEGKKKLSGMSICTKSMPESLKRLFD